MSHLALLDRAELRPEVEASWRDCVASGLHHGRFDPPNEGIAHRPSPLVRAGEPVARRLGRALRGTGVAVVLADERARILAGPRPTN